MQFGTIIVTKDRNSLLCRTVNALRGTEMDAHPIIVINNGSTIDNPRDIIENSGLQCEYIDVGFNSGIVGARILAHRIAKARRFTHYCFLQDDFELASSEPWLADTLLFIANFGVDYCRLTIREEQLGDDEHWVKGKLRRWAGNKRWNCSLIQIPQLERVGGTRFHLTDKHYSDWPHIMSMETSEFLFGSKVSFEGASVTDLLVKGAPERALAGAVRSELDVAVRHWLGYAAGLTSATGIVMERPCWCGLFNHIGKTSASGRRNLPPDDQMTSRLVREWVPS